LPDFAIFLDVFSLLGKSRIAIRDGPAWENLSVDLSPRNFVPENQNISGPHLFLPPVIK
jgi:hypothetical protein